MRVQACALCVIDACARDIFLIFHSRFLFSSHPRAKVIDDEQPNKKQTSGGGKERAKGWVGGGGAEDGALPAVAQYVENSQRPPPTGGFVAGGFDMVSLEMSPPLPPAE